MLSGLETAEPMLFVGLALRKGGEVEGEAKGLPLAAEGWARGSEVSM